MPHGLQITNDAGEISIDEEYNSHFAYLTMDPAQMPGNGWTSDSSVYNSNQYTPGPGVYFPATLDLIVWVRPKTGWESWASVGNGLKYFSSYNLLFEASGSSYVFKGVRFAGGPNGPFEIMISLGASALRAVQARQSTYGLEVYNSAGNIVFASDMKNLNIIALQNGSTPPATITFPAQSKPVWLAQSVIGGFGYSRFVGGPVRFLNFSPIVRFDKFLSTSITLDLISIPSPSGPLFTEDTTSINNRVLLMACTF
jgi:hypothetical protein